MTDSPPPLLRPLPRRPFELSSATTTPRPEEDASHESDASPSSHRRGQMRLDDAPENLAKSRSILNLTSSTLLGIYSPTAYDSSYRDSEPPTPWGSGAETPAPRASIDGGLLDDDNPIDRFRTRSLSQPQSQRRRRQGILPLTARLTSLFVLGVGYGALVSQLHDNQHISPVRVEGIDRQSWTYAAFWGFAGVGQGILLPYLDTTWQRRVRRPQPRGKAAAAAATTRDDSSPSADWSSVVRQIGAFIGIAYAIRKLPWSSPLQISLTLALVNPALWYLLDRTSPGFLLSTLVALSGTLLLLLTNPSLVPSPPPYRNGTVGIDAAADAIHAAALRGTHGKVWRVPDTGLLGLESVGVATWIASVLFCSCICFGNIGRRIGVVGPVAAPDS